jgi:hypothetical protein
MQIEYADIFNIKFKKILEIFLVSCYNPKSDLRIITFTKTKNA